MHLTDTVDDGSMFQLTEFLRHFSVVYATLYFPETLIMPDNFKWHSGVKEAHQHCSTLSSAQTNAENLNNFLSTNRPETSKQVYRMMS